MMAAIQCHHPKNYYSKWFLMITVLLLTVLALFQINLPQLGSNQVIGISQHRRGHGQGDELNHHHNHHHEYDIFTFPHFQAGFSSAFASEVPRLILGTEVNYIINNPVCDSLALTENGGVFMLILITSYVGDVKTRRKLREILPQSQLDEIKVKRLFLLANPPARYQIKDAKYADVDLLEIHQENEEFHDILMGDFIESYKSLTFKHLMGLEWAATFCPNAKFVLKQDDDIIVDYYQLRNQLKNGILGRKISNPEQPAIYGKILDKQLVERDPASKWFVSREEFQGAIYPPYVSGWAYITTISAIQEILKASEKLSYFFVDDAFVTGIIRERTSVDLIDMGDYFTTFKGQLLCCVSLPMFAKSKNNEPFWCDYMVGPSNDDLELMEIYQRHSQYCFVSKQCRRREENELLAKKCVITGNMKVQDFSQLHGQGKPRPLPVIRKQ